MAKKKGPTKKELDAAYAMNERFNENPSDLKSFNKAQTKYVNLSRQIQRIRAQIKALNKQVVKGISQEELARIQKKRKALEAKQASLKKQRASARQQKRVASTGQGGT